ncbi:MAG: biotin--[acetyl-CoA-carboxylase] ligase [Bacteroidetes bacterium RIFOXYA12_FULL_35_11]|nr:MAG: biotin--[acetyl-CoA-carboxylase] ligase [Bacteroidetes bacterium GWF2_35_48]OFY73133.1 MAG: biotin--[acetyl-CoA-carboxylase] ligase [Bacteroidetes bacterium RIFOXYA12_FULL_35_11]HBX51565.1 biotin--[acetyl-CoA-carboxylase] ligase [Bacteroidales bacterium]
MKNETIGSKIIKLEKVNSTNAYLKKLQNEKKLAHGTLVIADKQTAGKGRGDNYWESEKEKNLTFSFIIYPEYLKAKQAFYISKCVSLGIAAFVKNYVDDVTIKWPNDIYVGKKKIAGILIENSIAGDTIASSLIGIGININQTYFRSKAPNPVSLKQLTGINLDLKNSLEVLIMSISQYFSLLENEKYKEIDKMYSVSLYRFQEMANYKILGEKEKAKITGVDEHGRLQLEATDGKKYVCNIDDVSFL